METMEKNSVFMEVSETYWETQLDDFWGIITRVLELTFHFLSVCARYHYAKR